MLRPHANFFFLAPQWYVYVYMSELSTLTLTHEPLSHSLNLYSLTEHRTYESLPVNLEGFFFLMGTDKYDPVEMSTIKRTDEIKQCSRAQRITHQNKIYMRK